MTNPTRPSRVTVNVQGLRPATIRYRLPLVGPHARSWPLRPTVASPDPVTLAALHDRGVRVAFPGVPDRDADHWWSRCVRPGVHRFGSPAEGAVVVRVEYGGPVLRLMDLLPPTASAWDGVDDPAFAKLLAGVLGWAAARGAVAAEHRARTDRAGHVLGPMGFRPVSAGDRAGYATVAA